MQKAPKVKWIKVLTGATSSTGHILHLRRPELSAYTIRAVSGLKPPTNITKICLCLRPFIVSVFLCTVLARIPALLNHKLKKDHLKHQGGLTAADVCAML